MGRKGVNWSDLENKTTKTDGMPHAPQTRKWNQVFSDRQDATARQDNTAVKSVAPVSEPDWSDKNTRDMTNTSNWETGYKYDVRTEDSYKKGQDTWSADRDAKEIRKKPGNTANGWLEGGDKVVKTAEKRDGKWKPYRRWKALED